MVQGCVKGRGSTKRCSDGLDGKGEERTPISSTTAWKAQISCWPSPRHEQDQNNFRMGNPQTWIPLNPHLPLASLG